MHSHEYSEGWQAYFDGIDDNPYPHGSQAATDWDTGHSEAKEN